MSDGESLPMTTTRKEHLTRTAWIWLDEEGIAHTVVLPGAEETLDDAGQNMAAYLECTGGNPSVPLLLDLRAMKSIARDARLAYTPDDRPSGQPVALLIGSGYSRLAANFFVGLRGRWLGEHPMVRFFTAETEALAWLRGFVH
jgi:hypothetical protein